MHTIIVSSVSHLNDVIDHKDECFNKSEVDELCIMAESDASIPVSVCKGLFDSIKNTVVKFVVCDSNEELLFRLGCILDKEHCFVFTDGLISLPESVASEYDITYLSQAKSVIKSKSRSSSSRKKPIKKEEVKPAEDVSDVKIKAETKKLEAVKSYATSVNLSESAEADVNPVDKIKAEKLDVSDGSFKGYEHDTIVHFLKKSGVRAGEMKGYDGTDEELAVDLMSVLSAHNDGDKNVIHAAVAEVFPAHVDYIMNWIGSNLPALKEIAATKIK